MWSDIKDAINTFTPAVSAVLVAVGLFKLHKMQVSIDGNLTQFLAAVRAQGMSDGAAGQRETDAVDAAGKIVTTATAAAAVLDTATRAAQQERDHPMEPRR